MLGDLVASACDPAGHLAEDGAVREHADAHATVADDLGGDALHEAACHTGVVEDGEVGVGVDVDEAGGDGEAGGVEDASGGLGGKVADAVDTVPRDGNVGGDWVTAEA